MNVEVINTSSPPHVKQTVLAYQEAGYLDYFLTSFYEHPQNQLSAALKNLRPLKKEIDRRSFRELPLDKFLSRPLPELIRSVAARKMPHRTADIIWEWAELGFDRWAAAKLLKLKPDIIHTYEHSALACLQMARTMGIFSIYEQPSQHHAFFSGIVEQQFRLYPELRTATTELLTNEKAVRRNQRRDQELATASMILCNSTFTKRTLTEGGIDASRIVSLPLAFPPVSKETRSEGRQGPVIFLYAGNQSLRKAAHLLYHAWRLNAFSAQEAELWLIGKMMLPENLRRDLPGKVVIRENVPQSELMNIYLQAHVFVLPTLADGFGMVVTESMSQGLPVIASGNSCGPDVITPGKNGWLIPAGDAAALAAQMKWCAEHPEALAAAGELAKKKALTWQWPDFRKALTNLVFERWQEWQTK